MASGLHGRHECAGILGDPQHALPGDDLAHQLGDARKQRRAVAASDCRSTMASIRPLA